MTLRGVLSTFAIPIGLGLGLFWAWARQLRKSKTGSPVDTNDPLWREAIAAARASRDQMHRLHAQYGPDLFVKYPLVARDGEVEHVWGPLLERTGDSLVVGLATPPVGGLRAEAPFTIASTDLEDWQLLLPDGSIRGGFTTQAQIVLAQRAGLAVPEHVQHVDGKFVDVLRVAP